MPTPRKTNDPARIKIIVDNSHLSIRQIQAILDKASLPLSYGAISEIRRFYKDHKLEQPDQPQKRPLDIPEPSPLAGGVDLPESLSVPYTRFLIDQPGVWVVLSDVHLPYHDVATVRAAIQTARNLNANLLLNGDILDCPELSDHERNKSDVRFSDEVNIGRQFFEWVRSQLPKSRIIYKEGNHEERLPRYLSRNAQAVEDFVSIPELLELEDYGVEWVADKRVIQLGKLPILHAHEYRGGGGVNPARWLFLRTVSTALCGHFHRTSEHHQRGLTDTVHGVWSVGCACYLHPKYMPLNEWNHGFSIVTVHDTAGLFNVDNKRVRGGVIL